MGASIADRPAYETARLIRDGHISAVHVVEACLARIEALNATYRAYITILKQEALEAARRADTAASKGRELGPLHGVPVSVKDAFLVRGTTTTVGSNLLRSYSPPHPDDATCVMRMQQAGAIILGKVNVGSGMLPHALSDTLMEPSRNPWCPDRTPGGSSSGSAVSVALGMGYASIGSDLGGSIRIPAALTGVVGLKPTFGRVSQYGDLFGLSRKMEHVGPITRTVRDAALMLRVLAGYDPKDPTSAGKPVPDYVAMLDRGLPDMALRIGWACRGGPLGAEPEILRRVEASLALLASRGVDIKRIDLPPFDETLWYQLTLLNEWEAYDSETVEVREYFAFVVDRLKGKRQKVLADLEAQAVRVRDAYEGLLHQFDLLALPTVPITARSFDTRRILWGNKERDVLDLHLANAWMFNLSGHPAISLPSGLSSDGLPVGLQLVGRHFEEETLLSTAEAYEKAVGGFPLPPVH